MYMLIPLSFFKREISISAVELIGGGPVIKERLKISLKHPQIVITDTRVLGWCPNDCLLATKLN